MQKVTLVVTLVAIIVSSCGPKPKPPGGDELIWASEKPRPGWLYREPFVSEGFQFIIGLSYRYADEKSARDDAKRDARMEAVRYLETAAREHIERIFAEIGITSEVLNPSIVSRGYGEWVSQAVVQGAKIVHMYVEQWRSEKTKELYYLAFSKLRLPDEQVMESFRDYTNRKRQDWNLSKEQIDRVNATFEDFWKSKKKEQELKEQE